MNHKALTLLTALAFCFLPTFIPSAQAHDVNPILLSTFPPPPGGTSTDVAASGNLIYVCEGEKGLTILDASNSSSPQFVGSVDTPGFASAITLSGNGNLALVADSTFGLQIIDVSNPSAPTIIGSYDTPGTANGVVAAGNLAFVADGEYGLQIIDYSVPSQPIRVGGYNTFGTALSVAISNDHAYIADADNGLVVIDVTIPATAHRVAGYDRLPATHITISGNYAYVSGPGPLITFDISNPLDPQPISSIDLPGNVTASTVSGTTTYVASAIGGFHVLDTTDPFAPKVLGSSSVISNATRLATSGPLALVADLTKGLQIFAAANPAVMQVVAHLAIPGKVVDFAISGNLMYLADVGSLNIIDISNINDMRILRSYLNRVRGGYVKFLFLDRYAFESNGFDYDIVSLADPINPVLVSADSFSYTDIKSYGPYVIFTQGSPFVDKVNSSGKLEYVTVLRYPGTNQIGFRAFGVKDGRVWTVGSQLFPSRANFLFEYDLGSLNPGNAQALKSAPFDVTGDEIELSDTAGFVSSEFPAGALRAFDLNTLATVASTSLSKRPLQFAVTNNLLYLANGSLGIQVLHFDGNTFTSLGGAGLPDATAIMATTNYVFVGAGTNGLYVLTHYQPTARLEAIVNTNRTPQLRVFAPIGSAGRIQRAATLTTNSFQDWQSVQITSSPQILTDTNSQTAFYRFISP